MHKACLRIAALASLSLTALEAGTALADTTRPAGWGQAWDDAESAAPAVRAPSAAARPVSSGVPAPAPASAPAVGGWGDAWDEVSAPTAGSPRPPSPASAQPVAPQTAPSRISVPQAAPSPSASPSAGPATMTLPGIPSLGPALGSGRSGKPAAASDEPSPVGLTADQIIYDRELGIVTASGRVEIIQNDRALTADTVSYNLKQDIVAASGNVQVIEPTGDVLFADYFELTGDFKSGVAGEIRLLMADRSRMVAATTERSAGNRTDFTDATYTACEPCRKDPKRKPIWTVNAERVSHDQAAQSVEYRNAWVEVGGVPVLYTPYLSHPDPTVKRRSGFLIPTAGTNSTLGTSVTTPYFWAIADNQDLTLSPRVLFPKALATDAPSVENADKSVLQRVVVAGEHRWKGMDGESRTAASLTADRHTADLRGHIDAEARFDINNRWRTGYQIQRTSDDAYASLYGISLASQRPWLTTRPYAEAFGRRNYGLVEAYSFQGIGSTEDPGRAPIVLPNMTYSYVGDPNSRGAYWTMDSGMLAYARQDGTDATRLSNLAAWNMPFTASTGEVYKFTTSLRTDAYHADDLNDGSGSANSGRVMPTAALNWRYPLVRGGQTLSQVVEPLAMVAVSPNGGNPSKIPNEDSISFELDETNLMRPNRLVGLDRMEGGLRGAYGLRWTGYPSNNGTQIIAQAAQGWRAHADSTFENGNGFNDRLSDYAGRLELIASRNLSLSSRVRLDKDTLHLRRNEETLQVGTPALNASVTYAYFERQEDVTSALYGRRNNLNYQVDSAFSRYWRGQAFASHDLTDSGGPLQWGARLTYDDECFAMSTRFRSNQGFDEDYLAGYEITLHIVFKTLADVPVNVF